MKEGGGAGVEIIFDDASFKETKKYVYNKLDTYEDDEY